MPTAENLHENHRILYQYLIKNTGVTANFHDQVTAGSCHGSLGYKLYFKIDLSSKDLHLIENVNIMSCVQMMSDLRGPGHKAGCHNMLSN